MKVAKNTKAISKIVYILILVLAMIIGSIFSYMILAGYYLNIESNIPENPTISVIDMGFDVQNAESINITILNPTYSPAEATIKEIYIITPDSQTEQVFITDPELPYELGTGKEVTIVCDWDWGEYIDETIKAVIVVQDGSGAVYEIETASVELSITSAVFDTSDTEHFNMTINNPEYSAIDLAVTKITVTMDNATVYNVREITPDIPITLEVDTYTTFVCTWDWTTYRGQNITIDVYTSQGYDYHLNKTTPNPAQLSITDFNFDTTNTTAFDVTVQNSEYSIASANITTVEIQLEDDTIVEATIEDPADLPYVLDIGETVTLRCIWDWSENREESIIVAVESSEGYIGYTSTETP